MSLDNGYGVVIGTVVNHYIEEPDSEGRWPHYVINVQTPQGEYECVINLKSRTEDKIEYKDIRDIFKRYFIRILQLPDGYHPLESNSNSGALDMIRHPGLKNYCCRFWPLKFWPFKYWCCKKKCSYNEWWPENGTDIIKLMEYYLQNVKRIYIFGEPYNGTALGLHNVHMNQGDPITSDWSDENGIWQDGGTIIEYNSTKSRISVFLTKFSPQALHTDNLGRPV